MRGGVGSERVCTVKGDGVGKEMRRRERPREKVREDSTVSRGNKRRWCGEDEGLVKLVKREEPAN